MLFEGGFTFGNFVADAFTIFMFILWFWLLIVAAGVCSAGMTCRASSRCCG